MTIKMNTNQALFIIEGLNQLISSRYDNARQDTSRKYDYLRDLEDLRLLKHKITHLLEVGSCTFVIEDFKYIDHE